MNHLKILETLAMTWERKLYIEQRQSETEVKTKQLTSQKEKMRKSAKSKASGAEKKKNAAVAALIVVILGVIVGVAIGCFEFYSYDVSGDWYRSLQSNLGTVLGVCIGIPAVIGAIVGFFLGEGFGGAAAGAVAGAAVGGVITGIVFACCWVLVPLVGLVVIVGVGIGIHFLKSSMEGRVYSIKKQTRNSIDYMDASFNSQKQMFENESLANIAAYNNMIKKFAAENGIDLYKIGIDRATVDSIYSNNMNYDTSNSSNGYYEAEYVASDIIDDDEYDY